MRLHAIWVFITTFIRVRWGKKPKNRAQLLDRQAQAMRHFVQRWWPKSYFYSPYVTHPDDVPLMNKSQMMKHFNQLNTVAIDKSQALELARQAEQSRDFSAQLHGITVGLSSGTSAVAGIFLVSPAEQARWSATMLAKLLPRPFFRHQRIALFLRANSHLYESLNRSRWIQFRFFDLSQDLNQQIQALQAFSPTILVAPAQCLEQLALAQSNQQLSIAPNFIYSVAEVLPPDVRALVQGTWAQPVREIYQATEGFLAASCMYGKLHLNEAFVKFEMDFLDAEQRRFCPIITDFSRTSQLMVRYRLDDILHLAQEQDCPCGQQSLIIDRIEGRCDDVLYLNASSKAHDVAIYPDYLARALLLVPHLLDYRISQDLDYTIQVQWRGSATQQSIQAAIEQVLSQHQLRFEASQWQFSQVNDFPYEPMVKRRRIVSAIRPPSPAS